MDAVDVSKAVDYVMECMNFDGGFGRVPGSESHAGQVSQRPCVGVVTLITPPLCPPPPQVYCCVGALALADALYLVSADRLGWWLCERQLPSGGLNGNQLLIQS